MREREREREIVEFEFVGERKSKKDIVMPRKTKIPKPAYTIW